MRTEEYGGQRPEKCGKWNLAFEGLHLDLARISPCPLISDLWPLSRGTRFASADFSSQPLFRELKLRCNVRPSRARKSHAASNGEPIGLLRRNKNSKPVRCSQAAEITNQASGHDSVGRTNLPDRPASATWQRAALFDARLSSSDSTQSQSGRKFVTQKRSRAGISRSRPFFMRTHNQIFFVLCAFAPLRENMIELISRKGAKERQFSCGCIES